LFCEDFEDELTTAPNPVWSWGESYSSTNTTGMMYGE